MFTFLFFQRFILKREKAKESEEGEGQAEGERISSRFPREDGARCRTQLHDPEVMT